MVTIIHWLEKLIKIILYFFLIIIILIVFFFITLGQDSSKIQAYASLLTAASVFIALISYIYNKNRNHCIVAIEQITFFRKEIIPINMEFTKKVRDIKGEDYKFSRIVLSTPTILYTKDKFLDESKKQLDVISDCKTEFTEVSILNMLEEMCLKLIHFKVINHPGMNCLKASFCEIVEIHAIELLMQREVVAGNSTYSSILKIYKKWYKTIDRKTPEERADQLVNKI